MIQTRAIVIHLDGKNALVESTLNGGCGNCDSANGCGSSKLSQIFCSEPRRFTVRNECNAQPGSLVEVSLPEGILLRSALLMYIFPLVLMLSGAMLGNWLAHESPDSDAYSAVGGFVGLVSGFFILKFLTFHGALYSSVQSVILQNEDASNNVA